MATTKVISNWSSGNLRFLTRAAKAIIFTIDGTNRKVVFPASATLDVSAATVLLPTVAFPLFNAVNTVLTSAAGYDMTGAQLAGGMITDTTATGAIAAHLPTVAALVAAMPSGANVAGTSFFFAYRNPGNQTVTLTTNTGWGTLSAGGTMTIITGACRLFQVIFTDASNAVIYSLLTAAI